MIDQFAHLLFLMLAGHAFADFALQTPHHSAAKQPGNNTKIPWYFGLTCHSLIHGGIVALITGEWLLGVAETIMHAAIDAGKIHKLYGSKIDQTLHVICKVFWANAAISIGAMSCFY